MIADADRRILVVEHLTYRKGFYEVFFDWVALNLGPWAHVFDRQALRPRMAPGPQHTVVVPLLQDPVEAWSEVAFDQARSLVAECDARGIPVVNRIERLRNAGKYKGSLLMREAGMRTPHMVPVRDAQAFMRDFGGLRPPFFIREDWGHGSAMVVAKTPEEARAIDISKFARPVAIELIVLRDRQDRLFRKYRYVVAGERGMPHHMQASDVWVTRGRDRVTNDRTREEELAYIGQPCPHHAMFRRALDLMGLDFAAFDYAIDGKGQVLAWEANPLPHLKFSRKGLVYRNEALHRTMAVMAAMYFDRGGIALPPPLADYLAGNPPIVPATPAGAPHPGWTIPPEREVEAWKDSV